MNGYDQKLEPLGTGTPGVLCDTCGYLRIDKLQILVVFSTDLIKVKIAVTYRYIIVSSVSLCTQLPNFGEFARENCTEMIESHYS